MQYHDDINISTVLGLLLCSLGHQAIQYNFVFRPYFLLFLFSPSTIPSLAIQYIAFISTGEYMANTYIDRNIFTYIPFLPDYKSYSSAKSSQIEECNVYSKYVNLAGILVALVKMNHWVGS